jgi:NADH:ubiquinone reductase (H+-translocating)
VSTKKKIIVVGGGFAGIQLARRLDERLFDVLLIDKVNHHQFQPLFYQVATSQLEPSSISFPLRHVFRNKKTIQIRLAKVLKVDTEANEIITNIGKFGYDFLVMAMGCKTNYYGNVQISKQALPLKSTYDAISIRNHMLQTFEKIISAPEEEKEALLNFVIVGAGPTGVELAGAFAEIKKNVLPKDYHRIDFSQLSIILIEGSKHTLGSMSKSSINASKKYLERMGVKILTETRVENYDGNVLELSTGEAIKTKTVIWAAGVTGNTIDGLPANTTGPGNRIKVDRINKVIGCDHVFAVGDIAYMETPKYPYGHPQLANVAINQARNLARNLKRIVSGKATVAYEYTDLGSMATIGRNKAVVDLPYIRFKGYFAWFVWMFLHLMLILSVRNKLIIFINWAWAYVTKDTSLRLILTEGGNSDKSINQTSLK